MYNERPLTSDSDFYLIKEHEYVRRYKLSNLHYHSEFELIYVKKGCVRFFINHEIYDVRTGSVIFINSNIIHQTECAENNTVNIILQFKNPVDSAYALRYISGFIKKHKVTHSIFTADNPDTASLIDFMESILKENKSKRNSYKSFINGYLHLITAFIQRNKLIPDSKEIFKQEEIQRFNPLFEYVDKNYSQHITVDALGALMHLNSTYLCRIFKEITGSTLTEYINYVRIHKATKMLSLDKTLSEIAYECGFSSLTYFNRIFKKRRGYSASEYRKIAQYENINN